jgi:hypothetical protein
MKVAVNTNNVANVGQSGVFTVEVNNLKELKVTKFVNLHHYQPYTVNGKPTWFNAKTNSFVKV